MELLTRLVQGRKAMNDEQLFSDPGHPVSSVRVIPRGRAAYRADAESRSVVVRHLLGYEPFTKFCLGLGVDSTHLASSVGRFGDLVRAQSDAIRADGIEDASAVFLGNVLVRLRDDASWVRYGDEFPSAGTEQQQYEVLHLLDLLMDSDDATYRKGLDMIEGWARS
ncbi:MULTISPECIES: hypothetical protein [unclassified Microbacterium]|uniref:hypothetical protein n=1 Tax=unclassified Microbacterium TaxID=2609290 RepID=UPI00257D1A69|nr:MULTISPECIES: hypothetical protein [unclassified Microbacterium]|tara:strand:+ start:81 stop:578 length:498 start_codon:yes stop_codon:yes gene_type:complete